jgi:nucleoside phosphorylase
MIHDVFLDFLNRDSWEIYGFDKLPRETHLGILTEALSVAIFLCRDHCILPPGFLAESRLCREALIECRQEYFDERLVRLPMKEYSLDDFWDKKERQYEPFRKKYKGLFDPRSHRSLRSVSQAIIRRTSNIADSIFTGWQEAPDTNPIWHERIRGLSPAAVERIRGIPRQILEEGTAITWPAIQERITDGLEVAKFRPVLQNVYFSAYIREYDLKVITNLPYTTHPFVVTGTDFAYDYEALRAALTAAEIWEIVLILSAPSMVHLRTRGGYLNFREAFDAIAKKAERLADVRKVFTFAAETRKPNARFLSVVRKNSYRVIPAHGAVLPEQEIEEIAERLNVLAGTALEIAQTLKLGEVMAEGSGRSKLLYNAKLKQVAIFVALEMERRILIERWRLKGTGREQVWRGGLGEVQVSVFGRDEMGRVPAAIATMEFLYKNMPDFLLIAGIAGGFERENVSIGNILIPVSIVDLASRKLHSDNRTIPEFRPREFQTDARLSRYLKASFDKGAWETKVMKDAEWPDDRRPAIQYGPVASLDEVVADAGFVDALFQAWPKLLGIEMEAGGVCAAAESFGIKAAVIRGVSDLADPSKSDTEWRRRAVKTVAHLIENLDFNVILAD